MAGQQTMCGQIYDLTGQFLIWADIFAGQVWTLEENFMSLLLCVVMQEEKSMVILLFESPLDCVEPIEDLFQQ